MAGTGSLTLDLATGLYKTPESVGDAFSFMRPDDQNAPQVAVALFGDRSELLLAPGRILPRHQPDPGREIASRPEDSRVCHRRHDRSRPDNPDARDSLNPLARLARAMLHLDPLFDRSDYTLPRLKLRSQHDDAGPCIDRQPRVLFVRHDRAQFV